MRRTRIRIKKLSFVLIFVALFALNQLQAREEGRVEFTRVPVADPGGKEAVSVIGGRVYGAEPGQRIVIFARSENWYVQPYVEAPFTEIKPDATWTSPTHLGTEYAALLVGAEYVPSSMSSVLPAPGSGVVAIATVKGSPLFWQTIWFQGAIVGAFLVGLFTVYRIRVHQLSKRANILFEERLAERTRIAHELHDTLLQGFLSASLQLHVTVNQLPNDAPGRPQLIHIQELIGKVVAEGRDAVNDLRSSTTAELDPAVEFTNVRRELDVDNQVDFRVIVEGQPQIIKPLIWDQSYNIVREALTNAFRHSGAETIEVEIEYSARSFSVLIRDNGCGIDERTLTSGREGHWGLSGMRERAENIGSDLRIRSGPGAGTEVELSVAAGTAYETQASASSFHRLVRIFTGKNSLQNKVGDK